MNNVVVVIVMSTIKAGRGSGRGGMRGNDGGWIVRGDEDLLLGLVLVWAVWRRKRIHFAQCPPEGGEAGWFSCVARWSIPLCVYGCCCGGHGGESDVGREGEKRDGKRCNAL